MGCSVRMCLWRALRNDLRNDGFLANCSWLHEMSGFSGCFLPSGGRCEAAGLWQHPAASLCSISASHRHPRLDLLSVDARFCTCASQNSPFLICFLPHSVGVKHFASLFKYCYISLRTDPHIDMRGISKANLMKGDKSQNAGFCIDTLQ